MRLVRPASDGLYEVCWASAQEMIIAAARNDSSAFFRAASRIDREPVRDLTYFYMAFMAQEALWTRYGRLPTEDEIDAITDQIYAGWRERLTTPRSVLVSCLRTISNIDEPPAQIEDHLSSIAVTLALLLNAPAQDVAAMRPAIAKVVARLDNLPSLASRRRRWWRFHS